MKKFDTYMVNKIFTVPYLDRMISEDSIPDSFFECVRRYVKTDDATIGEAISLSLIHISEPTRRS